MVFSGPAATTPDTAQSPLGISSDSTDHTDVALEEPAGTYNAANTGNQIALVDGFNHGNYLSNLPVLAASPGDCIDFTVCDDNILGLGIITDQSRTASSGPRTFTILTPASTSAMDATTQEHQPVRQYLLLRRLGVREPAAVLGVIRIIQRSIIASTTQRITAGPSPIRTR